VCLSPFYECGSSGRYVASRRAVGNDPTVLLGYCAEEACGHAAAVRPVTFAEDRATIRGHLDAVRSGTQSNAPSDSFPEVRGFSIPCQQESQ